MPAWPLQVSNQESPTGEVSKFRVQSETRCQSSIHHIAEADMKGRAQHCEGARLVRIIVLRFLHTYLPVLPPRLDPWIDPVEVGHASASFFLSFFLSFFHCPMSMSNAPRSYYNAQATSADRGLPRISFVRYHNLANSNKVNRCAREGGFNVIPCA